MKLIFSFKSRTQFKECIIIRRNIETHFFTQDSKNNASCFYNSMTQTRLGIEKGDKNIQTHLNSSFNIPSPT